MLFSAGLMGAGVGLALGAAYMAGGMAQHATDYSRSTRIAQAAAGSFSEAALHRNAAGLDPGVLRVARNHDPAAASAAERERQTAVLAQRLERQVPGSQDRLLRSGISQPFARSALDSARELECLTQAVYFEARGETPRGQAAVAQVVLNRVRHPAFPKTICGVVFQGATRAGCQFSFACDGSLRRARETSAWTRARKIAARSLAGAMVAEVGQATHFHTTQVSPDWSGRMRRVAQVGLHVFYKFSPRSAAPQLASAASLEQVVMTAAPVTPGAELRLVAAVAETAADAAAHALAPANDPAAPPAPAPAQTPEAAQAPQPVDAAAVARASEAGST